MTTQAGQRSLHGPRIAGGDPTPLRLTDTAATVTNLEPSQTVVFADIPAAGGQDIVLPPAAEVQGGTLFFIQVITAGAGDDVTVDDDGKSRFAVTAVVLTAANDYVVFQNIASMGYVNLQEVST